MDTQSLLALVRQQAWANDRLGTQHRSELAHHLPRCGHSPGDLDLPGALTQPAPDGDSNPTP